MSKLLNFTDFGFKLAVINKLMYESNIITPPILSTDEHASKFDIVRYIETKRGLKKGDGDDIIDDEGYDFIPELKEYFENLEITDDMVQNITELVSDGGDYIYGDIIPFWDGEDTSFDVKSAEDVKLVPNLKKATLLFKYPGEQLIKQFKKFGVTLESI